MTPRQEAMMTRNARIMELRARGWTHREIGGAVGLTDGRVRQILSKAREQAHREADRHG